MRFNRVRLYPNRPLTKARADPVYIAALARAYSRAELDVEVHAPAWRVTGEIPFERVHAYFNLPDSVEVRHVGPRLRDQRFPRLLRASLALPALAAGAGSDATLHHHKDPLATIVARPRRGVHLLEIVEPPRKLHDRIATRRAHGLVAISPGLARAVEAARPELRGRVMAVRGGVDPAMLDRPLPDRAEARRRHGVEGSDPVVAYSGKVSPGSRQLPLVLEALAGVGPVTFLVAGGTPQAQAWLRTHRPANVTLRFEGYVPPMELLDLYAAADVLVSYYPSDHPVLEWMDPSKLYPYFAGGRPIVAADHPGMRDLLRNGDNAELAAPDDPVALRRAIARVLEHPELAARLVEGARRTARETNMDRRVAAILAFAERVAPRDAGTVRGRPAGRAAPRSPRPGR